MDSDMIHAIKEYGAICADAAMLISSAAAFLGRKGQLEDNLVKDSGIGDLLVIQDKREKKIIKSLSRELLNKISHYEKRADPSAREAVKEELTRS